MGRKEVSKKRLSKGILEMKFMQRTKAKVVKESDEEAGRAMYANEITEKMQNSVSNFIIEPSIVLCEGLREGRLSFRGMNLEIEHIMAEEQAVNREKLVQPTEVSDADMAKFYYADKAPAAAISMQRKFKKQKGLRDSPYKKGKRTFLKPKDD